MDRPTDCIYFGEGLKSKTFISESFLTVAGLPYSLQVDNTTGQSNLYLTTTVSRVEEDTIYTVLEDKLTQ